MKRTPLLLLICGLLAGCLGMPDRVRPVQGFELQRYLGTWYEVARLDHSFERGLQQVTARYALREDGGVEVINRGYSPATGEWSEAVGKAYFVEDESTAYLKVSFFGPFYGSYVVFDLDKADYRYAFVSGPDNTYLWLLSRSPTVPESVMERFVRTSAELGFDTSELILVNQSVTD